MQILVFFVNRANECLTDFVWDLCVASYNKHSDSDTAVPKLCQIKCFISAMLKLTSYLTVTCYDNL